MSPESIQYRAECDRLYGLWQVADGLLGLLHTRETSAELLADARKIRGELEALHVAFHDAAYRCSMPYRT